MRRKVRKFYTLLIFSIITFIILSRVNIIWKRKHLLKIVSMNDSTVSLDSSLIHNYIWQNYIYKKNMKISSIKYPFSVKKSNEIGGIRAIPDTRHSNCKLHTYYLLEENSVSVIITFYNECRSALLRTVLSVLYRTPPDILHEIILVDDNSNNESDGRSLTSLPYVKLIRNSRREGLIRSRNKGAKISSGKYVFFLDSHCEVNVGWVEPLLARLSSNPGLAASPIIDTIDVNSFLYEASSSYLKGGFDWTLRFKWIPLSVEELVNRTDESDPFTSPTFLGGIFIISRDLFFQLGGFDLDLNTWGGEWLDMSLKVWLCGGQIEVVPCSRIGHVFSKKYSYTFPLGKKYTYLRNSKRIVETWLDEYKHFYYNLRPEAIHIHIPRNEYADYLKYSLQCRSFSWYLQNVFPELNYPNHEYIAFGKLMLGKRCLHVVKVKGNKYKAILGECNELKDEIDWTLHSYNGQLATSIGSCLNVGDDNRQLVVEYCKDGNNQKWRRDGGKLIHDRTKLCMENVLNDIVIVAKCRRGAASQLFNFSVEVQPLAVV